MCPRVEGSGSARPNVVASSRRVSVRTPLGPPLLADASYSGTTLISQEIRSRPSFTATSRRSSAPGGATSCEASDRPAYADRGRPLPFLRSRLEPHYRTDYYRKDIAAPFAARPPWERGGYVPARDTRPCLRRWRTDHDRVRLIRNRSAVGFDGLGEGRHSRSNRSSSLASSSARAGRRSVV